MSNTLISTFTAKITELLLTLIATQLEEFSTELLIKIKNDEIKSIENTCRIFF